MTPEAQYAEVLRRLHALETSLTSHLHPNGSAVARLDERLTGLINAVVDMSKTTDARLGEIKDSLVRREEFTPVKLLTYGLVSLVMTGVVGALLSLVIMGRD